MQATHLTCNSRFQLTEELRDTGIFVNSVSAGFVKSDLNGSGFKTPEEGGRFIDPAGYTPW